jgi:hypothetical protein
MAGLGALGKALLVSGGIIWDEKATVVLMLAMASTLVIASIVVNARRRKVGGIVTDGVSLLMTIGAFVFAARGWR